jgi:hypothetical protein
VITRVIINKLVEVLRPELSVIGYPIELLKSHLSVCSTGDYIADGIDKWEKERLIVF